MPLTSAGSAMPTKLLFPTTQSFLSMQDDMARYEARQTLLTAHLLFPPFAEISTLFKMWLLNPCGLTVRLAPIVEHFLVTGGHLSPEVVVLQSKPFEEPA